MKTVFLILLSIALVVMIIRGILKIAKFKIETNISEKAQKEYEIQLRVYLKGKTNEQAGSFIKEMLLID